jgi:hypothetical protein
MKINIIRALFVIYIVFLWTQGKNEIRIRENRKTHFRFNPTQKRVHCNKNLHQEISGDSLLFSICLGQKRYKKYKV